ncbi:MAG: hypothetical protein JXB14_01220 [Candidatus Altiarchaeota archaeon]|nr:hypothetical protein [Candidatus Altiarchaeota archaeon]
MRILGKPVPKKPIKVKIVGEADEAYSELKRVVKEEIAKGITSSENQTLLRGIENAIKILKENIHIGRQWEKDQIPKKYIEKYDVRNLWRIELPLRWRLIYTMRSSEIEIINLILDFYNHKEYDKTFGYKKK